MGWERFASDGTECPMVPFATQASCLRWGTLFFLGRVYFRNGYSALATASQFIYQPVSKDLLQSLFESQNANNLEAHVQVYFATQYFSAEFSPYRVQYVAEVHNPNFPVVALHAAIERALTVSGGVPLSFISPDLEDFTLGTRIKFLKRDYVHGTFSLFDAITTDSRTVVPVSSRSGVLVDPVIGWAPAKLPWKPRASLGVKNIGMIWKDDPLFPARADLEFGLGIEPPVGFGRLRIGLDGVNLIHGADLLSRVRFGTSFQFGIMEAMAGFTRKSLTSGLQIGLAPVSAGIVYEVIQDDFGGGSIESKIATELSIRI